MRLPTRGVRPISPLGTDPRAGQGGTRRAPGRRGIRFGTPLAARLGEPGDTSLVADRVEPAHAPRRSCPLIRPHLTELAKRIFLVTGMTLCAGSAAAMNSAPVARPRASAPEAASTARADEGTAPSHLATIERSRDLSRDAPALECAEEEIDVEGGDRHHAPADDDAILGTLTSLGRPSGLGTPLVGCDAVGSHAPRGPPAAG